MLFIAHSTLSISPRADASSVPIVSGLRIGTLLFCADATRASFAVSGVLSQRVSAVSRPANIFSADKRASSSSIREVIIVTIIDGYSYLHTSTGRHAPPVTMRAVTHWRRSGPENRIPGGRQFFQKSWSLHHAARNRLIASATCCVTGACGNCSRSRWPWRSMSTP